jgi:hypothetical protein
MKSLIVYVILSSLIFFKVNAVFAQNSIDSLWLFNDIYNNDETVEIKVDSVLVLQSGDQFGMPDLPSTLTINDSTMILDGYNLSNNKLPQVFYRNSMSAYVNKETVKIVGQIFLEKDKLDRYEFLIEYPVERKKNFKGLVLLYKRRI